MKLNNNEEKKKAFLCVQTETMIASVSRVYGKWEGTAHTIWNWWQLLKSVLYHVQRH